MLLRWRWPLAWTKPEGGSSDYFPPHPCAAWQPPGGLRPSAIIRLLRCRLVRTCAAAPGLDCLSCWPGSPARPPCLLVPPLWPRRHACCSPCIAAHVGGGAGRDGIGSRRPLAPRSCLLGAPVWWPSCSHAGRVPLLLSAPYHTAPAREGSRSRQRDATRPSQLGFRTVWCQFAIVKNTARSKKTRGHQ
jgi:hypothetical protein